MAGVSDEQILLAILCIALTNVVIWSITGKFSPKAKTTDTSGLNAPQISYWTPYFGHAWNLLGRGDRFLKELRDKLDIQNASALKLFALGQRYVVLIKAWQIKALAKQSEDKLSRLFDRDVVLHKMLRNVFGLPQQNVSGRTAQADDTGVLDLLHLSPEIQSELEDRLYRRLERLLPDFISFMSSPIDQSEWERGHVVSLADDSDSATINLFNLLHTFLANILIDVVIHPLHALGFPQAAGLPEDLQSLAASLALLATGFSRFVPIPGLTSAHIARRRVLLMFTSLFRALDAARDGASPPPNSDWVDLVDQAKDEPKKFSPFLRDLQSKNDLSPETKASLLLAVMVSLTARINNLTYWSIAQLYMTGTAGTTSGAAESILTRLRTEAIEKGFVTAKQPDSGFHGVKEPVQLTLDKSKINNEHGAGMSLFKATYLESVRVYSRSVGAAQVYRDAELKPLPLTSQRSGNADGRKDGAKQKGGDVVSSTTSITSFLDDQYSVALKKGEYALTPCSLYNTDVHIWARPDVWDPERFTRSSAGAIDGADLEQATALGLDSVVCGGEELVRSVTMAYVAGFTALWEVELLGDALPLPKGNLTIAYPDRQLRARIKRRKLG